MRLWPAMEQKRASFSKGQTEGGKNDDIRRKPRFQKTDKEGTEGRRFEKAPYWEQPLLSHGDERVEGQAKFVLILRNFLNHCAGSDSRILGNEEGSEMICRQAKE